MHRKVADSRAGVNVDTTGTCVIRVSNKDLYGIYFSFEIPGFRRDTRRISCFWAVERLQRW